MPVLLTKLDTLATIEIIEGFFGKSRFQQPKKMERFRPCWKRTWTFAALYKAMGMK